MAQINYRLKRYIYMSTRLIKTEIVISHFCPCCDTQLDVTNITKPTNHTLDHYLYMPGVAHAVQTVLDRAGIVPTIQLIRKITSLDLQHSKELVEAVKDMRLNKTTISTSSATS